VPKKKFVKFVKKGVQSRGKMLGCVTRGDESDGGVDVGVTLEVRLHRFMDM